MIPVHGTRTSHLMYRDHEKQARAKIKSSTTIMKRLGATPAGTIVKRSASAQRYRRHIDLRRYPRQGSPARRSWRFFC